jgi:hypothetical protein
MRAPRLELRPSRALAIALALVHGAAAAGVLAALPGYAGLLLAALVLALGAAAVWSRAWLGAPSAVRVLELAEGGMATLELADGRRVAARVAGRRYVGRAWVGLPLTGAPHRTLLVVRDMLEPAAYRRLRLWALWGRLPRAAQSRAAP